MLRNAEDRVLASRTAIVADSDRACIAQVENVLKSLHYDVVAVSDPQQAGAIAKNHERALVLVAAPSGSSVAKLCQRLRAVRGRKFIILLLDQYRTEDVRQAFEAGADDVISKPLIDAELAARIGNASRILEFEIYRRDFEEEGALFAEIAARASVHSRRYLHTQLEHEMTRAVRFAHALSIVLTEVHFASADDRFMRAFGRVLSDHVRSHVDWIARYSERRFALVLPETELPGAQSAASRLSERLKSDGLRDATLDQKLSQNSFIVNFGVCTCNAESLSAFGKPDSNALLESAEAYLRDAARMGPNQVAAGLVPH